jgi:hypothetical protein
MRGIDGQTTHVMNAGLVPLAARTPALVAAAGARASYRFFEFFTVQIGNPNTRRAYARAAVEFFDWLAARGVTETRGHRERARRARRPRSAPRIPAAHSGCARAR